MRRVKHSSGLFFPMIKIVAMIQPVALIFNCYVKVKYVKYVKYVLLLAVNYN